MNKKIISLFLSAALFASSLCCTGGVLAEAVQLPLGDVNYDGAVNTSDALIILQSAVGKLKLDGNAALYADVDANGATDSSDALAVLQFSVGKIYGFKGDRIDGSADFPYYPGESIADFGSLSNTMYCFSGTSAREYTAYLSLLKEKGYTPYSENAINGNLYRGFLKDGNLIYTYFDKTENAVRIIDDKRTSLYTDTTGDAVTDVKLAVMPTEGGMGYVITLEDGRFFLIDSGLSQLNDRDDADRLFSYLKSLQKNPDDRIIIAAWLLTHEDIDHYETIHHFADIYGSQVTLESFMVNSNRINSGYVSEYYANDMEKLGCRSLLVPHAGQIYDFGSTRFEVLYTNDDWFPKEYIGNNETSTVIKMTCKNQTVLWTGDIEGSGSTTKLVNMYGSYLKCDILQVPHHGNVSDDFDRNFYKCADPTVLIWPYDKEGFYWWRQKKQNLYLSHMLHVKQFIVAGGIIKTDTNRYDFDGYIKELTLPYTPGSGIRVLKPETDAKGNVYMNDISETVVDLTAPDIKNPESARVGIVWYAVVLNEDIMWVQYGDKD